MTSGKWLPTRRFLKRTGAIVAVLALLWLCALAIEIATVGEPNSTARRRGDVAIVLGAAVYRDKPSPVFEQRIRHGISLYRTRRVRKLLFTGGYAPGSNAAEATVARRYALRLGVPAQAILTETYSRTTLQNLLHARRLMLAHGLKQALIVSDPLHLKRALRMAADLEMDAYASPTPTSRYRSWRSKAGFLLRELYFYNHYLITGQ